MVKWLVHQGKKKRVVLKEEIKEAQRRQTLVMKKFQED